MTAVIATQANNPRAAAPGDIAVLGGPGQTDILQEESVTTALERARLLASNRGVVVITGSIYIVGEALGMLTRGNVRQSV